LISVSVEVVNINNGERFTTYVIEGKAGGKDICLNGAAARKAHIGDKIIIIAYAHMTKDEMEAFKPTVVLVDESNTLVEVRDYI
jgi:aspartate 1-decarboxylase